jgi:hypothetical protein
VRRPISPLLHGILEYLTAPVWALAPWWLDFTGLPAGLAYGLAGAILVMASLTDYPLGWVRLIPFRVHGWIDYLATPLVVAAPWWAGFAGLDAARNLFLALGGFGLLITVLTRFDSRDVTSARGHAEA